MIFDLKIDLKKEKLEHVKRRPSIDKYMATCRLARWKEWLKNANIASTDQRTRPPLQICHDVYSDEDVKIFKEYGIEYCAGRCGDSCVYLKDNIFIDSY